MKLCLTLMSLEMYLLYRVYLITTFYRFKMNLP